MNLWDLYGLALLSLWLHTHSARLDYFGRIGAYREATTMCT